jgi:hypothetical protein
MGVMLGMRVPGAKDRGICWAFVGKPNEVAAFNKDRKKSTAELAKQLKTPAGATFLASCPTDNQIGTCESAVGLLVDYYSPTFTVDTARKHCDGSQMGTWIE